MIVDRETIPVSKDHNAEARAVIEEMFQIWEDNLGPITHRIYWPKVAPLDVVAFETEYESLAEYERLLAEFYALPELAPLWERWSKATRAGGTHEIWNVAP